MREVGEPAVTEEPDARTGERGRSEGECGWAAKGEEGAEAAVLWLAGAAAGAVAGSAPASAACFLSSSSFLASSSIACTPFSEKSGNVPASSSMTLFPSPTHCFLSTPIKLSFSVIVSISELHIFCSDAWSAFEPEAEGAMINVSC